MQTLWNLFEEGVRRWPDNRMSFSIMGELSSLSLTELHANALRLAEGLMRAGLKPGDTVAAQLPHSPENITAILASAALGLCFIPVVHIYGVAELEYIVRKSKARMLLMPHRWHQYDYVGRARALAAIPTLERIVMTGGSDRDNPKASGWHELIDSTNGQESSTPIQLPKVDPEAPCLMLFTSGTTSEPKGVLHNHRTLAAEARQILPFIDGLDSNNALVSAPAGHIGGVSSLLRQVMFDINGVWLDRWDTQEAISLIKRFRITWSAGVPFYLDALLPEARAGGIPSLKRFMVGGTSVPPTLIEQANRAGIIACRSYGSTEHPTISQGSPDDPLDKRTHTDGRLGPGCRVRLVDDDGKPVAAGQPGEIISFGDELFLGYFDVAQNATAFAADGGFHTGDIGVLDKDGYLSIVDRKKDIIIRGGENISSRAVEDALLHLSAVREAAAIGWPDPVYGERIGAFIVLNQGASLSLEDIQKEFSILGLARQKIPERIVFVNEIPRNASGKAIKAELRRQASEINRQEAMEHPQAF